MKKKLKELEKRIAALENKCVVDGCNNDVMQEHHIITVVSGDVTREQPFDPITNPMLRLCDDHHDAIHEVKKNKGGYRSNELIKTGIAKAREKTKTWGRRKEVTDEQLFKMISLRKQGLSIRKIAKKVGLSTGSVCRYTKEVETAGTLLL